MATFNQSAFRQQLRNAQRKAEQKIRNEVDRINRENKRAVDSHNRKVEAHNRHVLSSLEAKINDVNQRAEAQNRSVAAQLRSAFTPVVRANVVTSSGQIPPIRSVASSRGAVTYRPLERRVVERLDNALAEVAQRAYDSFLSYARIDGAAIANELRIALENLGVSVWFDYLAINPGRSQALQMDTGLRKARTGIALLTPAYLVGRFWTERELGALLHKSTLIPVLHQVTFEQVSEYSGILPDLAGFTTAEDSVAEIAAKIAAAILPADALPS